MNRFALSCAAVCANLVPVAPAFSDAEEDAERARNVSTVKACLAIADAKQQAARASEESAEDTKTGTTPESYFAAAADYAALVAGYAHTNCIGVVADPCAEAAGYGLMAEQGCIGVESEVWDILLNSAYRAQLGLPAAAPQIEETLEEEAAEPHAAEPVPDCQPVSCDISANDNLRKAQRAFAAWRDAMCDQNYISSRGGRENQIEIGRCRMSLTARQMFWIEYGEGFER